MTVDLSGPKHPVRLALLGLAGFTALTVAAHATDVEVRVSPVNSAAGSVRVQVCRAEEWLKDCALSGRVAARAGVVKVVVPGVAPGTYAVVAFHDANDNGDVDQNFLGIPTEGVGFSRVTSIPLGEPSFGSAALRMEGERVVVPVRLFFEP